MAKRTTIACPHCQNIIDLSSPIEHFWSYVDKRGACWLWLGQVDKDAYGDFRARINGERKAHRLSYTLAHGAIPPGKVVCHTCDNPRCVNPAHLFLGTIKDNVRDMIEKDRKAIRQGAEVAGSKLTEEQVKEIRTLYTTGAHTHASLAQLYNVSKGSIQDILTYRTWKHVA